jgi:hypothetical protein
MHLTLMCDNCHAWHQQFSQATRLLLWASDGGITHTPKVVMVFLGCFGRDSSGLLLQYATGDSSLADCLAKPIRPPGVYAGIRYGITGVCHQAANRILYAAGITVAQANGYGASVTTWGSYGRGAWPERDQCVQSLVASAPALPKGDEADMSSKSPPLVTAGQINPDDASRAELQALADASLGPQYDQTKIATIINLQQMLHSNQDDLVRQLDQRFISKKQYLDKLNDLLRRVYSECEKVLGRQDFEKLFGAPLNQIDHMVDPDVFLAAP